MMKKLRMFLGMCVLLAVGPFALNKAALAGYSEANLVGRWFYDYSVPETDGNSSARFCVSVEIFPNNMSQSRGEVLISDSETSSTYGARGKMKFISQEKDERVGDRVVSTTVSGSADLTEFYVIHNGQQKKRDELDEAGKKAFDELFTSYEAYVNEYVVIGELTESRITKLESDRMTLEFVDPAGTKLVLTMLRTEQLISECK